MEKPLSATSSPSNDKRRNSRARSSNGKQRKEIPIDEARTMGEAIQMASSISHHLFIAEKFVWLPTDDNLLPHFTQLIHHEKRRRWGSQLLEGLGNAALASWENDPIELHQNLSSFESGEGSTTTIWTDERLARAIMSVALPMDVEATNNRPKKEGVWIAAALKGLHSLSGCILPTAPCSSRMDSWMKIHEGISILIQSADKLSEQSSLKDAIELRWAIRGLTSRLQMANTISSGDVPMNIDDRTLDFSTPVLNSRTLNLPFDIAHCLPWQMDPSSPSNNYYGYPTQNLLPALLQSIPFHFDTLTTRTGNSVIERRGTSWLAEDGIGALAYSGKLMRPSAVPDVVREIMRDVEQWCVEQGRRHSSSQILLGENSSSMSLVELNWDDSNSASLPYLELGQFLQSGDFSTFFDCALCNHYPDGDSACKFHTDPEHGSLWHPTTCVISCGASRIFAFRPIPELSTWSEWDGQKRIKDEQLNDNAAATLQLFPGDLVFMSGNCNEVFHHAVYSSPFDEAAGSSRVSLVLKRALDRGRGKKGHGLAGSGRRARQRKISQ